MYLIRNVITQKVYVGQTKNVAQRKAGHLYDARRGLDRPLYRSIRKHGAENFVFEVLEQCEDDLIDDREQYWVSHFDSFNPECGYNLTTGGHQNYNVSNETCEKLSASGLRHQAATQNRPEVKAKRSKSLRQHYARHGTQTLSDVAKERFSRLSERERHREIMSRVSSREEIKKQRSENAKRRWDDPAYREKMILNGQKPQKCGSCGEFGHNRRTCKDT